MNMNCQGQSDTDLVGDKGLESRARVREREMYKPLQCTQPKTQMQMTKSHTPQSAHCRSASELQHATTLPPSTTGDKHNCVETRPLQFYVPHGKEHQVRSPPLYLKRFVVPKLRRFLDVHVPILSGTSHHALHASVRLEPSVGCLVEEGHELRKIGQAWKARVKALLLLMLLLRSLMMLLRLLLFLDFFSLLDMLVLMMLMLVMLTLLCAGGLRMMLWLVRCVNRSNRFCCSRCSSFVSSVTAAMRAMGIGNYTDSRSLLPWVADRRRFKTLVSPFSADGTAILARIVHWSIRT